MAVPRASVNWTVLLRNRATRAARSSTFNRSWQRAQRRGYASDGSHTTQKAASDLPWMIGAVAVTVPSCAYLLQPKANGHGHGHDDGEHGGHEKHEEASEGEGEHTEEAEVSEEDKSEDSESTPGEQEKSSSDQSEQEGSKPDDSGSDGEEQQDTPATSDDDEPKSEAHETEGGGNVEGVQFKGATKDGEQGDTRKHIPDAKGYNKKRIESDYGKPQGTVDEAESSTEDKPAAAKSAGSQNTQSGKQEGMSNTDTKHSTDITNDSEQSTKGEGTPETSKSKGTVQTSRPQK